MTEDRKRYCSSRKWKWSKGDKIQLSLGNSEFVNPVGSVNQNTRTSYRLEGANPLIVIEYTQTRPSNLNMINMPTKISAYSHVSKLLRGDEMSEISFTENRQDLFPFSEEFVESAEGLPIISHMKEETTMLIRESNFGSSILHKHGREDNMFVVSVLAKGKNWLSFECTQEEYSGLIYKPTRYLLSVHCQLKTDVAVTLPKQEIFLMSKQKYKTETMLKRVMVQSMKKYTKQKIGESAPKWKVLQEDFLKGSIKSSPPSPLVASRLHYNKLDMERFKIFFNELFKVKDSPFTDINNAIITMFAVSCFPLHTLEMIDVLRRVEDVINTSHWSESVNFSNLNREKQIMSRGFMPSICPIFRYYFEYLELKSWDSRLEEYVEKVGKKYPPNGSSSSNNGKLPPKGMEKHEMNKQKITNQRSFYFVRRMITKSMYYLEYMEMSKEASGRPKTIEKTNDVMRKIINDILTICGSQSNNVDVKKWRNPTKEKKKKKRDNVKDTVEILTEQDILKDLEDLEDLHNLEDEVPGGVDSKFIIQDYDDLTINSLKRHDGFLSAIEGKDKYHKKKEERAETSKLQINYSHIFTLNSPHKFWLHPEIEDKLSNPYKLIMKYGIHNN